MSQTTYLKVSPKEGKRVTTLDPDERVFSLEERLEVQNKYQGQLSEFDDELARYTSEINSRKAAKQLELDEVTRDVNEMRALGIKTSAEIEAEKTPEPAPEEVIN